MASTKSAFLLGIEYIMEPFHWCFFEASSNVKQKNLQKSMGTELIFATLDKLRNSTDRRAKRAVRKFNNMAQEVLLEVSVSLGAVI